MFEPIELLIPMEPCPVFEWSKNIFQLLIHFFHFFIESRLCFHDFPSLVNTEDQLLTLLCHDDARNSLGHARASCQKRYAHNRVWNLQGIA